MGLADEFTVEMACFVTGDADAKQILSAQSRTPLSSVWRTALHTGFTT